jgi:hypothetical protein
LFYPDLPDSDYRHRALAIRRKLFHFKLNTQFKFSMTFA